MVPADTYEVLMKKLQPKDPVSSVQNLLSLIKKEFFDIYSENALLFENRTCDSCEVREKCKKIKFEIDDVGKNEDWSSDDEIIDNSMEAPSEECNQRLTDSKFETTKECNERITDGSKFETTEGTSLTIHAEAVRKRNIYLRSQKESSSPYVKRIKQTYLDKYNRPPLTSSSPHRQLTSSCHLTSSPHRQLTSSSHLTSSPHRQLASLMEDHQVIRRTRSMGTVEDFPNVQPSTLERNLRKKHKN